MNDDIQVLDTGQDTDTSTYTPYEVIGFENGTLVTPASANLETGAVTMPVYSGKAPINATNLNHLEQGLKDLETYILTGGSVFGGNNPIGSISLWNTNTPPVGYLICDGTTYSKSQYPDLYDALGSDYQISAEQFKVPDFRGLIPIGAGTHQDTNSKSKTFTLGAEYGEYEHKLVALELPKLGVTFAGIEGNFNCAYVGEQGGNFSADQSGDTPHNNIQPSLTVNFIIKAIKSDTTLAEIENSLASDSTTNAPSIHAVNEAINQLSVYSANETVVGKWIDDKPIYRKVLTGTWGQITAGSWNQVDIPFPNLERLIKIDAIDIMESGGNQQPFLFDSADNYKSQAFYYQGNIRIRCNNASQSNCPYHIIVEYTKTTD